MAHMRNALGLMSGTSMDGIDLALISTDGETQIERGPTLFIPYEPDFRRRLEQALVMARTIRERDERPGDLRNVERELSLRHAEAVRRFLEGNALRPADVDVIGFHGQTVLHRPQDALTVQLGDGPLLARQTGIDVAYDMRANDMRFGGQGAPLVPAYHVALVASLDEKWRRFPICIVNIGGISNITYIPETGAPIAFDSGPGNALIDQWVLKTAGIAYDADGKIAQSGVVDAAMVKHYLSHPFYEKPAPKSLDRNDFTIDPISGLNAEDGARTLARVTAEAIFDCVRHLPDTPKLWIICGGGRHNPVIMGDLSALALEQGAEVVDADTVGFDGDAMEAEAWAYLAVRSGRGLPLTFPTTTGCREAVTGGVLAKSAE